jgi:glycine/D-amino acid oxidase-like deaminating enzyme
MGVEARRCPPMALGYSDFSGWIDPPGDRCPALDSEVRCDVAVVGGGYTGMAAAIRLAERGADVVLLEASFCGWGASSRNAGHLTPTIAGDPQLLATVYRRRAGALVGFADAAVHFVEDLIEWRAIDCDYEPVGNVSAALSRGQLRRAERIARMLAGVGGEVEFVEGAAFGLPERFLGGILEQAGGVLNPGKFARGLRGAVLESGARVYEESAVEAIDPGAGGVDLRTARGRVTAERVLLATNAYTRDMAIAPRRVVAPLWVTLAETEPIEADRIEAAGWRSRAGLYTQHMILESYRLTRSGTVVYGSRNVQPPPRSPLGARKPDAAVVHDITRGLHDRFPSLRDVKPQRTWGGWIAMTPSWIPVAGEAAPSVFYAVGYNGHGLAQAPYLGTLMADRLAGDKPHEHLKVAWREQSRYFPAPLMTGLGVRTGWAIDRITDRFVARLPK